MVAIGYADDILIMVTPGREKDAIRIAMAEYERLKLEVNTNKTSSNDKTLFENNSGIVTYLGQEFGQDAKPLTDQILANVQERIGSLFDLDISLHNRYTLYEKCILTCANYGPLVDVCDDTQENIKKYLQIDDELIKGLRKIIEVNVPKEELMRFALSHKCKGGAHQIYPGQHYNLMKQDQYEKERLINELEGETLDKIGHDEDNEANSRQRKLARTFLSKTRQDGVDYENKFGTYDEITPRIAYTLQNYRRQLPNEALRYLTNTRFVKEKEDLIPTQCPNCGGKNSPYHETNCKKAQEYHIGVHDKIVDHIEQVLRQYKAVKVSKENHNRLYDGIKPDIAINYRGERIYLDVGVTWYKEKYYKAKVKHYQGYEAKIIPIIVGKNCTLHKESHLFLKELKVNMQTFYAEIGYKISRCAQMCNNSLYKKRNLEKETNLEEAPIGKLDMNKFAPLADLGEDNDKSEKEPIEKFLFQQNKWNNSHASQSDSYTFTSQMGENRRRKSNHQKANTSARQINRQNKFASLNSEDSSSNSGNFSHYQEQPHRKEQNTHRTDHRKPDKVDYSAISEASEALQSLIQSCSSSMKKSFKQNNQSFRSQKQTEHNKKNKQNNQSNTEQSKLKGSQLNQSKKNQIKELVKSFNKILNGNQKPKGNSFTGQQNHNSSTKQRATTDQNPYIYIKQCEMNNCFDRKQQNKNNDAYKKNWKKHSWNQADVVQKLTKVLQKTLKQQGNYFDRNNNKFNNNQGKLFNSLNEYRYNDVKSKRNDDSFMYVKIPIGQTNFSKQNKGGNKSFGGYKQGNFNQKFI
ncbi:Reverse_transcriptase (RNA-dependent DNA polymerase) [Hexamita inflata]|uniref:Reverse transcriptase (RNA-dependent DNA polymerase) n=2 Tax=Hexamita inflata TaxID=28002 RepID=A0AA86UD87_9EUKA|nr:Reverse transcriptase (RNA-dependent DNA polymerase) [Hexamita inflata]